MAEHQGDFHIAEDYPLQPLVDDCRLLGSLLDDCLRIEVGDELFNKIERIRTLSECAQQLTAAHDKDAGRMLSQKMAEELFALPLEEALPIVRAFGHYLNLTSIAEQHHSVRTTRMDGVQVKTLDEVLHDLVESGISPDQLYDAVTSQHVEIVLTAHPTQVNRRTLQHKHTRIATLLAQNDRKDLTQEEREHILEELIREITALWQTDELRRRKPTPLDEARGGLHIVEQSLWSSLPKLLRRMSSSLKKHTGRELPIDACPIRFGSWMGGDRDGNPNVTAKTTLDVATLSRWMAADLYLKEVDALRFELSMSHASDEVLNMAHDITNKHLHGEEPAYARPPSAAYQAVGAGAADGGAQSRGLQRGNSTLMGSTLELLPQGSETNFADLSASAEDIMSPLGVSSPAGGPSSPRGNTWAHGRGTIAEAAANALSKGSPRGVTPNHSALALAAAMDKPAAAGGSASVAAIQSKLHKLTVLPPGMAGPGLGSAPSGAIPNQGLHRVDTMGKLMSPTAMKRRGLKAAEFHKSSVDALLHPRQAGANPYRVVLGEVRQRLVATRRRMEELLAGHVPDSDAEWYETEEQLLEPLLAVYWSLWECGGGIVAEGRLLDLLRRIYSFGLSLMKLDLRQESGRHTDCLAEVTEHLGLGNYGEWPEEQRLQFLTEELQGRRPLIPPSMPFSPDAKEVMDTLKVAAVLGRQCLSAYVISMATRASDVLAVELLQREARFMVLNESGARAQGRTPSPPLRVVPLFETLSDLEASRSIMQSLFSNPWYRQHLATVHNNTQEVMLGYSDSGKDAGRLAAAWALYKAQEELVAVCKQHSVELTLFHGRGGTVGRGGGPMQLAILSQPPGSVEGRLRITEQGEMVQAKFGVPSVALRQLEVFSSAVLTATLQPPKPPKDNTWRTLMEEMSAVSCKAYRGVVFEDPQFISYFQKATPQEELGNLNIGSRPTRRKATQDVTSLRAIPWIFAWTQTRLVLPAWLGVADALLAAASSGQRAMLRDMYQHWPFFQSLVDLIEMVLSKADMRIAALYDTVLVGDSQERALGDALRRRYQDTVAAVLMVTGHARLEDNNPTLRRLIEMRNPHVDPINVMQVEILRRLRRQPDNPQLRDALLLTINGVAAGMRNTG
ncbi:phosphoenolpyruvate carboxylase 4 [Chlorella sorokiniana]|uniref:phosphoenolpyruvate carboxylase n=1 Tax=Chlorella sorokiniana TaxID=3076 RepID=A0A2P6TIW5_CHLSO|nr:phosphoenolpyruvate carboxylase 4 [Chlorella sorokiniana]|eukprot:PRW39191.1 phosphoenolpyruvate carboxylase 4 [Chlorella sorokiniana]